MAQEERIEAMLAVRDLDRRLQALATRPEPAARLLERELSERRRLAMRRLQTLKRRPATPGR